jgi:hypothetical protein
MDTHVTPSDDARPVVDTHLTPSDDARPVMDTHVTASLQELYGIHDVASVIRQARPFTPYQKNGEDLNR